MSDDLMSEPDNNNAPKERFGGSLLQLMYAGVGKTPAPDPVAPPAPDPVAPPMSADAIMGYNPVLKSEDPKWFGTPLTEEYIALCNREFREKCIFYQNQMAEYRRQMQRDRRMKLTPTYA